MFSSQNSQVSNDAVFVEDVFSTYLYAGNGSTQTITNGIDLSGKGGLIWFKRREATGFNALFDTVRGVNKLIYTNTTDAQVTTSAGSDLTAFNSNGFSLGPSLFTGSTNASGASEASWTFRKQPKFFDVVTYTGNGTSDRTIAHNLTSTPGCIIVKRTDSTGEWYVYHREITTSNPRFYHLRLNSTAALAGAPAVWDNPAPSDTTFTVQTGTTNDSGATYVAYLFAHNAGGFGLTGTDNVISCGSFTSDSSGMATVNLGYEAQWVLMKNSQSTEGWYLVDNMRGNSLTSYGYLQANTSAAELAGSGTYIMAPTATGFLANNLYASNTYIYIAIRRGPMKVPTSGTSVFTPVSATPSGATTVTTNFPVDLAINAQRDAGTSGNKVFWDRLRGSSTAAGQGLFSNLTNAEVSYSGNGIGLQSNTTIVDNYWNTLNGATTPVIYWNLRRAPSFFDVVCYTGTGVTHTETHNLGVAPELIIVKRRASATASWAVYAAPLTASYVGFLDLTNAFQADNMWNSTAPTSTAFTVRAANAQVNASGSTYVAYLFATCAGVSKVGSYTGNGSTQTIDCGFTGGARFVLIKRTDSTGDWYVYDTARGIVTANDPHLSLNTTAAEVTTDDTIDTDSTGFIVNQVTATNVNVSSATYIYLAIA